MKSCNVCARQSDQLHIVCVNVFCRLLGLLGAGAAEIGQSGFIHRVKNGVAEQSKIAMDFLLLCNVCNRRAGPQPGGTSVPFPPRNFVFGCYAQQQSTIISPPSIKAGCGPLKEALTLADGWGQIARQYFLEIKLDFAPPPARLLASATLSRCERDHDSTTRHR